MKVLNLIIAIPLLLLGKGNINLPSSPPSSIFYIMRAFPSDTIPQLAVKKARERALKLMENQPLEDAVWEEAGPYNIGGRITAIAASPQDASIVYCGTACGGVFKSSDGGVTWEPIFDETGVLSIGAIAVSPNDPNTIYVGTGEANGAGDTFDGGGVYVTHDGGETWELLGLEETRRIGRIVINPEDENVIFVAAMGKLFGTNEERGVMKSTDGGNTWERVLFVNDTTGCIDIVINPLHPDTVYAAMWQRIRRPGERISGGEGSGIYRSTDGGDTWEELTNGLPVGEDVGRIGISISKTNPLILYAIYADKTGYFLGVYKTTDGGDSWFRINDDDLEWIYSSYGWYFGQIRVDPTDPDIVYALGIDTYKSLDGGNSWQLITFEPHVDHHDLYIDPNNPSHLYLATDGGFYISNNAGWLWNKSYDLPITQFYDITVDFQNPERIYGGTQDNGTVRTLTGSLSDWEIIYCGDGFHTIVDYTNSNIIYTECQYGSLVKSTNGGYNFFPATYGINDSDRRNWDTPVVMDPCNPEVLYYGTFRVYKTENGADLWYPISGDLTNGPSGSNIPFGTITSIEVSPADGCIYAGTDDGNVWVSKDGGSTWENISSSLPDRWVTDIKANPVIPGKVYVSFSGYYWDDYTPYIFLSEDTGATWIDVTDNLPPAPVNAIEIWPEHPQYIFVGTDFGVYLSRVGGGEWVPLLQGLPLSPVLDLAFHNPTSTLIAGTHGRSSFKLDVSSLLLEEKENSELQVTSIKIYPNPVKDFIVMEASPFIFPLTVRLYSISGRFLKEYNLEEGHKLISIVNLKKGPYILHIENNSFKKSFKILKVK